MRTYNVLRRAGYGKTKIMQCQGMAAYQLIGIRNMGYGLAAIVILMLEHYGVRIEIPDSDCDIHSEYYMTLRNARTHNVAAMKNLKRTIEEYRDRIVFIN